MKPFFSPIDFAMWKNLKFPLVYSLFWATRVCSLYTSRHMFFFLFWCHTFEFVFFIFIHNYTIWIQKLVMFVTSVFRGNEDIIIKHLHMHYTSNWGIIGGYYMSPCTALQICTTFCCMYQYIIWATTKCCVLYDWSVIKHTTFRRKHLQSKVMWLKLSRALSVATHRLPDLDLVCMAPCCYTQLRLRVSVWIWKAHASMLAHSEPKHASITLAKSL